MVKFYPKFNVWATATCQKKGGDKITTLKSRNTTYFIRSIQNGEKEQLPQYHWVSSILNTPLNFKFSANRSG